ncbi:M28 family peptidase [Bacteroidota bacterium]
MKPTMKILLLLVCGNFISSCNVKEVGENNPQITEHELQMHIDYLASEELEGRGIGSEGLESAAKYVIGQFHGSGINTFSSKTIKNYLQTLEINKSKLSSETSLRYNSLETTYFKYGSEYIMYHFGLNGADILEGEVVFTGTGIYEPEYQYQDYNTEDVRNKWIVINELVPTELKDFLPDSLYNLYADIRTGSTLRAVKAHENGAIGVLTIPSNMGYKLWDIRAKAFKEFHDQDNYGSFYRNAPIPMLFIDSTMNAILKESVTSNKTQGKLVLNKGLEKEKISSSNIIGFVEGTDPVLSKEFIVIGAHIDHMGIIDSIIYNGANDDASGTTAVIELAEAIADNPMKRSVIFTIFTAHEVGVIGSTFFIENPPVPLENIKSMVHFDMIGRSDSEVNKIALVSPYLPYDYWKNVIKKIKFQDGASLIDWEYSESFPYKYAGDHYPFFSKGIPSMMLFSGYNPDYHMPTDDSDKIDYKFLKQNAELSYSIIKVLANE